MRSNSLVRVFTRLTVASEMRLLVGAHGPRVAQTTLLAVPLLLLAQPYGLVLLLRYVCLLGVHYIDEHLPETHTISGSQCGLHTAHTLAVVPLPSIPKSRKVFKSISPFTSWSPMIQFWVALGMW